MNNKYKGFSRDELIAYILLYTDKNIEDLETKSTKELYQLYKRSASENHFDDVFKKQ